MGKTVALVHHTTANTAKVIVKSKQWKDPMGGSAHSSFGRLSHRDEFSVYGDVALVVKVPRKKITRGEKAYGMENEL